MSIASPPDVECRVEEEARPPLVVTPNGEAPDVSEWASHHREWVDETLVTFGAILFRGFAVPDPTRDLGAFAGSVTGTLLDYVYRSTPRTKVGGAVHTATEYPARVTIPQHNELAYTRDWPMRLMFCCAVAPSDGGQTPLADSRAVTRHIDEAVRALFREKGVRYVRNYRRHIDLPWQTVFQTSDPKEVDRFCAEHAIEFSWKPDGGLQTSQQCQGTAIHPLTRDELWFNQSHLFHVSSLDESVREAMASLFSQEDFPRNSYFGDGTEFSVEMLEHVREAFDRETVQFDWQVGDVLLLDNMLVSHGRRPFSGSRKVLVAMGDAFSATASPEVFPRLDGGRAPARTESPV